MYIAWAQARSEVKRINETNLPCISIHYCDHAAGILRIARDIVSRDGTLWGIFSTLLRGAAKFATQCEQSSRELSSVGAVISDQECIVTARYNEVRDIHCSRPLLERRECCSPSVAGLSCALQHLHQL